MLNKNYSFPFKSWGKRGKETEAFATGQWEVLCNTEKRDLEAVSRLYCKTSIDKMVLLQPSGSCPGVVQSCLGLLETSAQKHVWLQVTGAPGAALDLKHITRAALCPLHAAQRGWTCKLICKAEEVSRSTKRHLSSYLSATPLKNPS